ncbi:MAG: hypothetical protein BEN19_05690 [Epulopiscium sp. Nuni2H_MBin003]|nr:MAG: hypothetical protein BEN19_05690 [Epulopiscium sp. Nuni2H_MBin003]
MPIYAEGEQYINSDLIGVYYDNSYRIGEVIAQITFDVLVQQNVGDRLIHQERVDVYQFDYNKIYEYDVIIENLPADIEIINQKPYEFLIPNTQKLLILVFVCALLFVITHIIRKFKLYNKKLQEQKIQNDTLKEVSLIQQKFFGLMTHEFRTPINIINSSTKLIEMDINSETIDLESCSKKVKMIYRNIHRLNKLINNILDITKYESGKFEANFTYANLVTVIEEVVMSVVPFADTKNIDIVFDTDVEEVYSVIDVEQIERMMLNLMSNAIKFSNTRGSIFINLSEKENKFYIEIRDEGDGMSKADLSKIFEIFYQSGELWSRRREGTGLGLYIVNKVIEQHNGSIQADSIVGQGTTFMIELPINDEKDIQQHELQSTQLGINLVDIEMSDV